MKCHFYKNKFAHFIFAIIVVGIFLLHSASFASAVISPSGPIIPCGSTSAGQPPCNICHVPYLIKNLADYMFTWVGIPLAIVIFAIAGIRMIVGSSKESEITAARSMITNALIGLGIMLAAWIIVNTAMLLLTGGATSFNNAVFSGPWNQLPSTTNCPLEGPVGTSQEQSSVTSGPAPTPAPAPTPTPTPNPTPAPEEQRFVLTITDPNGLTTQIGSFRSQAECQAEAQAVGSKLAPACDSIPAAQVSPAIPEYLIAPDRKVSETEGRAFIAKYAIDINHTNDCGGLPYQQVAGGCTSMAGVLGSTLDGVEAFKIQCGCYIKITAGAEAGHADGGASHSSGKKLDLSATPDLTSYITRRDPNNPQNYVNQKGSRSDGTPTYTTSTGVVFAYEIDPKTGGAHWDVQFSK